MLDGYSSLSKKCCNLSQPTNFSGVWWALPFMTEVRGMGSFSGKCGKQRGNELSKVLGGREAGISTKWNRCFPHHPVLKFALVSNTTSQMKYFSQLLWILEICCFLGIMSTKENMHRIGKICPFLVVCISCPPGLKVQFCAYWREIVKGGGWTGKHEDFCHGNLSIFQIGKVQFPESRHQE